MTCLFVRNFGIGVVVGSDTRESAGSGGSHQDGCQKLLTTEFGFITASGPKIFIEGVRTFFQNTPGLLAPIGFKGEDIGNMMFDNSTFDMLFHSMDSICPDNYKSDLMFGFAVVLTVAIGNKENVSLPKIKAIILDFHRKSFNVIDDQSEDDRLIVLPRDIGIDRSESVINQAYATFDKVFYENAPTEEELANHSSSWKATSQFISANVRATSAVLDEISQVSEFVSRDHHVGVHLGISPHELPISYGTWDQLQNFTVNINFQTT